MVKPVCQYFVVLPLARVCEGYERSVFVSIYAEGDNAAVCCLGRMGKHYHLPLVIDTSSSPTDKAAMLANFPHETAEGAIREFEKLTAAEKAEIEIHHPRESVI